jgi:ABC-type lipoprotein release transport system permease subunit
MMLLQIAWRNLWRNKRRSLIILTSIVIGVAAMDWMDGLARGYVIQMLDNQLGAHTAHMQIHAKGFNDNKVVQNYMLDSDTVASVVKASRYVKNFSRRVVAFGLLSSASNSSGVSLIGIEPDHEARITTIHNNIVEGRYLGNDEREIVISRHMAKTLDVGIGDRLVAMASALDGTVGSEMFRVVGIYQSSSLSFDKMYVYVPLRIEQQMLRVNNRIAEIAVLATSIDSVDVMKKEFEAKLRPAYEVLTYRDILPSLVSQIEMMNSMMYLFYVIIGAALIFGIINTFLMAVYERIHEFGILKSIGMKNIYLLAMIELEALFLGLIGCLIGTAIGAGIVSIIGKVGLNLTVFSEALAAFGPGAILYPIIDWLSLGLGAMVIVLVCLLAALYPARRAMKLEPMQAIMYV